MNWAGLLLKAAALLGAGTFIWFAAKYGLGPLWTKLVSFGAVAKSDLAALEARVVGLETAVGVATPAPVAPAPSAKPAAPVHVTAPAAAPAPPAA